MGSFGLLQERTLGAGVGPKELANLGLRRRAIGTIGVPQRVLANAYLQALSLSDDVFCIHCGLFVGQIARQTG